MMLPPDTSSVTQARRGARKVLATWNAEVFEWAASQLVSELAANAVLHAGTPFVISLSLQGSRLRCEVSDTSSRPPRVRHYSAESSTGRGMRLVEQLSSAWGVIPRADGKTVWFELDAPSGRSGTDSYLDALLLAAVDAVDAATLDAATVDAAADDGGGDIRAQPSDRRAAA
jgi:anti-sigma regulatory factor (Ser/Thr protein kinase)